MNRRQFLSRIGLGAGGAVVGAAGTTAGGAWWIRERLSDSGHAVGVERPHGIRGTSITWRANVDTRTIALTFDDGPSSQYTARLLDILDSLDVPATFFCIGLHVHQYPDLVKRAAERHEIGNHTWNHPDLSLASAAETRDQLHRCHDEIMSAIGRPPTVFRPPFGRFSGAAAMVAAGLDYPIVLWDNKFDEQLPSSANVRQLAESTQEGTITLGHDGGPLDAGPMLDAIPSLVARLSGAGFEFVTVSDLLDKQAASVAVEAPDDNGTITQVGTAVHR
jgi:peptidoglycan/xylan/chitin deacetylase (PgdA/CDA1 family)